MAFKFNGGHGAVICDIPGCSKIIDSGLSYHEYELTWGKNKKDGDLCMRCRMGKTGVMRVDGGKEIKA